MIFVILHIMTLCVSLQFSKDMNFCASARSRYKWGREHTFSDSFYIISCSTTLCMVIYKISKWLIYLNHYPTLPCWLKTIKNWTTISYEKSILCKRKPREKFVETLPVSVCWMKNKQKKVLWFLLPCFHQRVQNVLCACLLKIESTCKLPIIRCSDLHTNIPSTLRL